MPKFSWVWGSLFDGEGWLKAMGFIDFAGSTVVHSIGGWVALAGIIVLGPRLGRFGRNGQVHYLAGHNLPLVALGGFVLWLAWFGFNAASTVKADVSIGRIALNTHLAACASAVAYMVYTLIRGKAILMRGTINASLGGLVAITAGCATMSPLYAIISGAVAGVLVSILPVVMEKLRLDDVVDAVTVHGFCGAWGTLAAGLFFENQMFNAGVIAVQGLGILTAFAWRFCKIVNVSVDMSYPLSLMTFGHIISFKRHITLKLGIRQFCMFGIVQATLFMLFTHPQTTKHNV
jgi:ammonium transporter, Amt family